LQDLVKMKMPETRRAFGEEQVKVTILRFHCVLGRTTREIEAQLLPGAWAERGGELSHSILGTTGKR